MASTSGQGKAARSSDSTVEPGRLESGSSSLSSTEWQQVAELFEQMSQRPAAERASELQRLARVSPRLWGELVRLLDADDRAGAFLAVPAAASLVTASPAAIGPYRVLRSIGAGGMGEVYEVVPRDDPESCRLALKVLRAGLERADLVTRFRRERDILKRLRHPNIAKLLDAGVDEAGRPYIVMEYVEGTSIEQFVEERPYNTLDRMRLFVRVCDIVDFAHRHLVVHRDLKPSNILVTESTGPVLLDFGIARLLDPGSGAAPDVTATAMRVLTPGYASPEHVRGEPVTRASDVYSLGALLYRLLTSVVPAPTSTDQMGAGCAGGPGGRPPSQVLSEVGSAPLWRELGLRQPSLLDQILGRALALDPVDRYKSARELAEDVRRFVERRPLQDSTVIARLGSAGRQLVARLARLEPPSSLETSVAMTRTSGPPEAEQAVFLSDLLNLAQARTGDGALADAFELYERVASRVRDRTEAETVPPLLGAAFCHAMTGQATILAAKGQPGLASRKLREALAVAWRGGPVSTVEEEAEQFQWVSTICSRLGNLLLATGDREGAMEHYRQAVHANEEVTRIAPADRQGWINLAGNLLNVARALDPQSEPIDQKRVTQAMNACVRSLECWARASRTTPLESDHEVLRADAERRLAELNGIAPQPVHSGPFSERVPSPAS